MLSAIAYGAVKIILGTKDTHYRLYLRMALRLSFGVYKTQINPSFRVLFESSQINGAEQERMTRNWQVPSETSIPPMNDLGTRGPEV
jgi:hypothetical protein